MMLYCSELVMFNIYCVASLLKCFNFIEQVLIVLVTLHIDMLFLICLELLVIISVPLNIHLDLQPTRPLNDLHRPTLTRPITTPSSK